MSTERLGAIELRHRFATLNGVRMHWVEAGAGPLVVLLHGFPDFWYSWRHQIPALVGGGMRVVAPDLRGYNESGRPRGRDQYAVGVVATDVVELLALLAGEDDGGPALLAGHDWGGVIAWRVAQRAPERLRALAILNAPHPAAYRRALRGRAQMARSWYAAAFQVPVLAEVALGAFDFALLRRIWRASERNGGMSDADLARYRAAFAGPGALTAALAYYRAAARRLRTGSERGTETILPPTLVIWGARDPALSIELTQGLEEWVPVVRVQVLPDAGHWVHLDEPETVNRLLLEAGADR